jgi:hypothetical protein
MPRFFFDTHDGDHLTADEEGLDLDGIEQAREEAVRALPDLARDLLPDGDRRSFAVTVRDESGTALLTATLTLRVEPLRPERPA